MKKEYIQKLNEDFPEFYKKTDSIENDYFYFECGSGWYDLLYKLSENIQEVLDKSSQDDHVTFKASQVKEKFGCLRFYYFIDGGNSDIGNKIYELINKAEKESAKICEVCGKNGCIRRIGWIKSLCSKHYFLLLLQQNFFDKF